MTEQGSICQQSQGNQCCHYQQGYEQSSLRFVCLLCGFRRCTEKNQAKGPRAVQRGKQTCQEGCDEKGSICLPGSRQYGIFRRQGKRYGQTRKRGCAESKSNRGERHALRESAHASKSSAPNGVVDGSSCQKQRCLVQGLRQQQQHSGQQAAAVKANEHQPDLAHGRVGQRTLQVALNQCRRTSQQRCERAYPGHNCQ